MTNAQHIEAAALFVRALCDDSKQEHDWLRLATRLVRVHEQRYCLNRALVINPDNTAAKTALAQLPPIPAHLQQLAGCA